MKVRIYFVPMCLIVTSTVYLLLFSGCQVGPDYVRPEYSVPDQWHEKTVKGLEDGSADLQTWWKVFNDPVLEITSKYETTVVMKLLNEPTESRLR